MPARKLTLSISEVASQFGLQPQTLRNWVSEGKISCTHTRSGYRKFRPSDIEKISQIVARRKTLKTKRAFEIENEIKNVIDSIDSQNNTNKNLKIQSEKASRSCKVFPLKNIVSSFSRLKIRKVIKTNGSNVVSKTVSLISSLNFAKFPTCFSKIISIRSLKFPKIPITLKTKKTFPLPRFTFSPRRIASVLLMSFSFQLLYPALLFFMPTLPGFVRANGMISETVTGNALFENKNPDFQATFGDRENPTSHKVTFSSKGKEMELRLVGSDLVSTTKTDFSNISESPESTTSAVKNNLEVTELSRSVPSQESTPSAIMANFEGEKTESTNSGLLDEAKDFATNSATVRAGLVSAPETAPHDKVLAAVSENTQNLSNELIDFNQKADKTIDEIKSLIAENSQDSNIPKLTIKESADSLEMTQEEKKKQNKDLPSTVDAVEQAISDISSIAYEIVPNKGVKESIIIQQPLVLGSNSESTFSSVSSSSSIENTYTFLMSLDKGVTPKKALSLKNQYYFVDELGNYLYHFDTPYMFDNAGVRSNDVKIDILPLEEEAITAYVKNSDSFIDKLSAFNSEVSSFVTESISSSTEKLTCTFFNQCNLKIGKADSKNYLVVLTANSNWLNSNDRVFPITIDPTILHDSKPEFATGNTTRTQLTNDPSVKLVPQEIVPTTHTGLLYHFNSNSDGNQSIVDVSGNANDGTLGATTATSNDDPKWNTKGIVGGGNESGRMNALEFDMVDDFVKTAASTSINVYKKNDITIEGWIYPRSSGESATGNIWSKGSSYLRVDTQSGNNVEVTCNIDLATTDANSNTATTIAINQWHHVACLWNSTTLKASIYLDGIEASLNSPTTGVGATTDDSASAMYIGGNNGATTFDGFIDEFAIQNRSLTPEEIASHATLSNNGVYTSPVVDLGTTPNSIESLSYQATNISTGDGEKPYSTDGLIAAWNFNETSGTTAYNSAGENSCGGTPSSCNGTLTSFASTASQDQAAMTGWTNANKKFGTGALMFDGTDDYVTITNSNALNIAMNFTSEVWVKTNSTAQGYIYRKNTGSEDKHIRMETTGKVAFYLYNNFGGSDLTSVKSVNDGQWHQVVGTYDGLNAYLYIDGKLDATKAASGDVADSTGALCIGESCDNTVRFQGVIDAFRWYTRTLSPSEILANYQAGNIQIQTRTGATSNPNDGSWEAWKPTTGETQIAALDSDKANWNGLNPNNSFTNSSSKVEGTGSLRINTQNIAEVSYTFTSNTALGSSTQYDNYNITINNGVTVTMHGTHVFRSVTNNGTIAITPYNGTNGTGELTIKTNSKFINTGTIDGSGRGYGGGGGGGAGTYEADAGDGGNATGGAGGGGGGGVSSGAFCRTGGTGGIASGGGDNGTDGTGGCWASGPSGNGGDNNIISNAGTGAAGGSIGGGGGGGGALGGTGGNAGVSGDGTNGGYLGFNSNSDVSTDFSVAIGSGGGGGSGSGVSTGTNGEGTNGGSAGGADKGNCSLYCSVSGYAGGGGAGGAGIKITSDSAIINSGTIKSNGGAGGTGSGNGGGGAGGGIALNAPSVNLTSGTLQTKGNKLDGTGSTTNGGTIKVFYNTLTGSLPTGSNAGRVYSSSTYTEQVITTETTSAPDPYVAAVYHLDETNSDLTTDYTDSLDSSGNANNSEFGASGTSGTDQPSLVQGIVGKARSFDGSNDYAEVADGDTLDLSTNGTIEAWIMPTTNKANNWFLCKDGNYCLGINATGAFLFTGASAQNDGGTSLLARNQWYHVAVTNNNTTATYYINGVQVATDTVSWGATITNTLRIGRDGSTNYFQGSIDEVRISNIVRSADEIADSYRLGRSYPISRTISSADLTNSSYMPFYVAADRPGSYLQASIGESAYANYQTDANTVGMWSLDEQTGSGAYIKDGSGNTNHLTPNLATVTNGKLGKGYSFTGAATSRIEGSITNLPINASSRTLSAWFRTTDTTARHRAIAGYGSAAAGKPIFVLDINASHKFHTESGSGSDTIDSSGTVNDGIWHFSVITYDGTTLRAYLDGQLIGSSVCTLATVSSNLGIGEMLWDTTKNFIGDIDEVRLDNTARSAADIRAAYEFGRRTHPITIDFTADLNASTPNLIADSNDFSFRLGSVNGQTVSSLSQLPLFTGDKVIVKENYAGTEYIAQGTVSSIDTITGDVTVTSWDSDSSFPTGTQTGFSASATVFKWQREYFDLTNIPTGTGSSDTINAKNAITRLTLRLTDGNEGRNIWLDDFRTTSSYLGASSTGSNQKLIPVTSTANRYIQYRSLFTSPRDALNMGNMFSLPSQSPTLANIDINYNSGTISHSVNSDESGRTTDDNTLGMWEMNTNSSSDTTAVDSTHYGNTLTGTSFSSSNWATDGKQGLGKTYNAITLDGANDYLSQAYNSAFDFSTNSFSVESWFKHPTISGSSDYLIARFNTGGWKIYMDSTGNMCFGIDNDGTSFPSDSACTTGMRYDDNTWHHVAGVKTSTTSITLYIDGELVATDASITSSSISGASSPLLYIGVDSTGNSGYWEGSLDHLIISNKARTQAEIRQASSSFPRVLGTNNLGRGGISRIKDLGTASSPQMQLNNKELVADQYTSALWHFDNSLADSSGRGNTLTANSNASFTNSQVKLGSHAGAFDGTGDFFSAIAGSSFDFGASDFAVEFWYKDNGSVSLERLFQTANGDVYTGLNISTDASNPTRFVAYASSNGSSWNVLSALDMGALNTTNFSHYALVRNGNIVSSYKDGVLVSSTSVGTLSLVASSGTVILGGQTTPERTLNGYLDEFRITKGISRSAEEIKANAQKYPAGVMTSESIRLGSGVSSIDNLRWSEAGVATGNGEIPYSSNGLVAQWNFNETTGTTAVSGGSCGTSCNGTLTSFASTTSQDQAVNTGWTANNKKFGDGAVMLDGTDDNILIGSESSFDFTGDMSVELWVKPGATQATSADLLSKHSTGNGGFALEQFSTTTNKFTFGWGNGTTYTCASASDGIQLTANVWQHVVFSKSGATVSYYKDGINTGSCVGGWSAITTNDNSLYFGKWSSTGGRPFNGHLDTTRIYNRALTANEVLSNYQSGNIQFQTRTGSTATPDDGTWESWKPTTGAENSLESADTTEYPNSDPNNQSRVLYHFENASANQATNSISCGSSCDLTQNGTVPYSSSIKKYGSYSAGPFTTSNYLKDTDSTNALSTTSTVGGGVSTWVMFNTINSSSTETLWYGEAGANDTSLILKDDATVGTSNNNVGYLELAVSGSATVLRTPELFSTNTWYHVTTYWQDGAYDFRSIYVNGVRVATDTVTGGHSVAATAFYIGVNGTPANPLLGYLDDLRIFIGTRTDAEIATDSYWQADLTNRSFSFPQKTDSIIGIEPTSPKSLKLNTSDLQPDGNTVALYHLDETNGDLTTDNTDVLDSSGNANNGEFGANGTGGTDQPSLTTGISDKGRSFDGTDDSIIISDANSLDLTSTGTIEAWVKIASNATSNWFVVKGNNYHIGGTTTGALQFSNGTTTVNDGSTKLVPGAWHHVAVTEDNTTAIFYIDGVRTSSQAITFGATLTNKLRLGYNGGSTYMNGSLDEVRISNVVRSAEEIAESYRMGRDHYISRNISTPKDLTNNSLVPFYVAADKPGSYLQATIGESAYANYEPDANTVGLWHLDELGQYTSAQYPNFVKDSSGSTNHGMLGNGATTTTFPTSTQGKIGKGRYFDGGDYISIPNSTSLDFGSGDFAIDWWEYRTDATNNKASMQRHNNGAGFNPFLLGYNSTNVLYAYMSSNGTTWDIANAQSMGPTTYNSWTHLAITRSGSTFNIYKDGQLQSTWTSALSLQAGTGSFEIGRYASGNNFVGNIDEVTMIKGVSKNARDIRAKYEIGKRTHPISIDFSGDLNASSTNLIADANDLTFRLGSVNGQTFASNSKIPLYSGEKVIVKENYAGTESIAQGTVSSVDNSNGDVTVVSWDSGSTFPTGNQTGFGASATVFKWQREYFDLGGITTGTGLGDPINQRDSINRITMRLTDGNEGRNIWLDDFRAASYLSNNQARTTTVTSSPNTYIQYRALLSTNDGLVSPTLSGVTLQYHTQPRRVLGADTMSGPNSDTTDLGQLASNDATLDNDGNTHLGDSHVTDTYVYDRTKDKVGFALDFDGTNDYVDIATGPSSVKTIGFWVYPRSTTGYFVNLTGTSAYIWANAGTVTATGVTSPTIYVDGVATTTIVANKWQYITVTTGTTINASNLDFGRTADANYLSGKMDEIFMSSDTKTAADVNIFYNSSRVDETNTTKYSNLLGLWHFDKGMGTTATDSVGTSHGTLTNMTDDDWVNSYDSKTGGVLSQQNIGVDPNWANGVVRKSSSLTFDGTNDYVDLASLPTIGTGDFSIFTWIKTSSTGARRSIINYGVFTTNRELYLYVGSDNLLSFDLANTVGPRSSTTVTDGKWHYVGVTNTAGTIQLYIDGKPSGSSQVMSPNIQAGHQWISRDDSAGNYFNGSIDELAIFNDSRTSSEISADFRNRRHGNSDANLVALYHFDEGEDNTCTGGTNDLCDSTSNANNGAKTNMTTTNWAIDALSVVDNKSQYVKLGSFSSLNNDRGLEIKIDTNTTFKYRYTGDQNWTTPTTATLSSYSFTSPAQIDSTGVYVGFDTTNGSFGIGDFFRINSWAVEQFSNNDPQNAMRGNRRDFPEIAYIVGTNRGVDILDSRDNSLWMRIDQFSDGAALGRFNSTNRVSSVFMNNGQLFVGTNGSAAAGAYRFDFNSDKIYRYSSTGRGTNTNIIAKRNTDDSNYTTTLDATQALQSSIANDVHAIIAQGQMLMATATSLGATVIKDLMAVKASSVAYDYYNTSTTNHSQVVLLENPSNSVDLYTTANGGTAALERFNNVIDDSADDTSATQLYNSASTPAPFASNTAITNLAVTPNTSLTEAGAPTLYLSHNSGTTILNENLTTAASGSVKFVTNSYISEEMPGAIKAMWPFHSTTTGNIANSTAITNVAPVSITSTASNSNGTGMQYVSGVRGTAISFDGTDDVITTNGQIIPVGAKTISYWLKTTGSAGTPILDNCAGWTSANGTSSIVGSNGGIRFFNVRGVGGSSRFDITSNTVVNDGSWHFITQTWDGTTGANGVKIYVDGTLDTQGTAATAEVSNASYNLIIGAIYNTGGGSYLSFLNGRVDEITISATAISATQVQQMYISGKQALEDTYRAKLRTTDKDSINKLAGDTTSLPGGTSAGLVYGGLAISYPDSFTSNRPDTMYVSSNLISTEDDGKLSRLKLSSDTVDAVFDENTAEPYLISDNDISSISSSLDGAYVLMGTESNGITVIHQGSNSTRLRGGKHFQGPWMRPLN